VEDVADPAAATPRPRAVSIAVWLLWAQIAVELLDELLDIHDASQSGAIVVAANAYTIVLVGGVCWLIFMIGRRRNWARIIYAFLFALGMTIQLVTWEATLNGLPRDLVAIVLQSGLQLAGVVFVFQRAANAWFRTRRVEP
jgi:hypothetical protein